MRTNVLGSGALPMKPEADRRPICDVMSFPWLSTALMLKRFALKLLAVEKLLPVLPFTIANVWSNIL